MKKQRYLSYGAGVQTFSLLILAEVGEIEIDEVIFADTGAEHPETYYHIEKVAKPIAERIGIPFTVVRMKKMVDDISGLDEKEIQDYKNMLMRTTNLPRKEKVKIHKEYCEKHNIPRKVVESLRDEIISRRRVPSVNPSSRWCTSDAKILPIQRYIRDEQKKGRYEKPAIAYIGLSYEELYRMYNPHLSEYIVEYPLIERKMTRKDCVKYINQHGYVIPPKSGCYFCPFQSISQWKELRLQHPELFRDAMMLEEMDLNYPSYGLLPNGKSLRKLDESLPQYTIFEYDISCQQKGYCGV